MTFHKSNCKNDDINIDILDAEKTLHIQTGNLILWEL